MTQTTGSIGHRQYAGQLAPYSAAPCPAMFFPTQHPTPLFPCIAKSKPL